MKGTEKNNGREREICEEGRQRRRKAEKKKQSERERERERGRETLAFKFPFLPVKRKPTEVKTRQTENPSSYKSVGGNPHRKQNQNKR